MKNYWTQPSLSRDFALLSAAVFGVLFVVSMWVTYVTYTHNRERITSELQAESNRIEMTLKGEMESANYLITALGRQIIVNNARDLVELAQILKSYDAKGQMYAVFNWISVDQKIIVSSNRGILDKPVDVSDRDFVKKAFVEPWKMHIGRPIEGRVSGLWVIPVAMGLTDYTGKFIGTLIISLDIGELTNRVSTLVKRSGISFAIISKTLIPLTQVSEDKDFLNKNFPAQKLINIDYIKNPRGLLSQGSLFWETGSYSYYSVSSDYPYIILMGYDNLHQNDSVRNMLWSRLLQMVVIAAFFMLFLFIVRSRMIRPVMEVTEAIAQVARGNTDVHLPTVGPIEIGALATQVSRVKEYIEEHKRVDDELRNKMFMLRQRTKEMEVAMHSKAEFLAFICQEMRTPVNSAMGCAQVMKDQIYGPIENKKYRQYASDIYASCNHVISQLDDLLGLAKIEAHYVVLRESTMDVATLINQAVESIAESLQAAEIQVKNSFEDGELLLFADEFRVRQMISNAFFYLIEQGLNQCSVVIDVKTVIEKKDRQNVEISLSYPFIKQDEDMLSTQFELLKRLAELHQGAVTLTSTTLTISLPGTRIRFAEF